MLSFHGLPSPGTSHSRSAAPVLRRACACGGTPGPTGECEACRKKRLGLQRSAVSTGPAVAPPIVHDVLRSPGRPLDPATRAEMEPRFGHSFADVRVHADGRAARSAEAVAARAYTVGRDVVFASGRYAPASTEGRGLLAHELAHVVQQRGTSPAVQAELEMGAADSPHEREARRAAEAVIQGGTASVSSGGEHLLSRQEADDDDERPRPVPASAALHVKERGVPAASAPRDSASSGSADQATASGSSSVQATAPPGSSPKTTGSPGKTKTSGSSGKTTTSGSSGKTSASGSSGKSTATGSSGKTTASGSSGKTTASGSSAKTTTTTGSSAQTTSVTGSSGETTDKVPADDKPGLFKVDTELGGLSVGNFDFLFSKCAILVQVRVKFAFENGIKDAEKSKYKARFFNAVHGVWGNSGYSLAGSDKCPCKKVPIQIVATETTGGDYHKLVDVEREDRREKVISDINLSLVTDNKTMAHEFGHVLGLYDEYDGGLIENAMFWHRNRPDDPKALMNTGSELRKRYFQHYRAAVQETAGAGCQYSVSSPAPSGP